MDPVLSHHQARSLLAARDRGDATCETTLDLGRSRTTVNLDADGVALPGGRRVPWRALARMLKRERACFAVTDAGVEKIAVLSTLTDRVCALCPTASWPTMLVSGFLMHRVKGTDPERDTRAKVAALGPVAGPVLDTCTGLGYTAIVAARTAPAVTTVELDPAALEICRQNPWSRELFAGGGIESVLGDAADLVPGLPDGAFAAVVHDPPDIALAGQLYAEAFYAELRRVLVRGGRLFHYLGNPDSARIRPMVAQARSRLARAGFRDLRVEREAFGVSARV